MKTAKHKIELSNTDKVLFPGDNITKGDLVRYYQKISEIILPYLKERPLTMNRFPNGIDKEGFFQQEASDYFPAWIERVGVEKEGGDKVNHPICQNQSTLVYLANQAVIVLHVWLSRRDRLNSPDQMVFDLDPSDDDFEKAREAAFLLRKFLKELDLNPLVKTTGSRGLHVVLPLNRTAGFDKVRTLAREIAEALSEREPGKLTTEQRKDKRKGRVLVDYVRNSYGQTVVAPYSVRARPGAPVATPLEWNELTSREIAADSFNITNIFQRLAGKKDPWQGMRRGAYSAESIEKKLHQMKR